MLRIARWGALFVLVAAFGDGAAAGRAGAAAEEGSEGRLNHVETVTRDVVRDGQRDVKFRWPTDATFSPDSKFAYVVDDQGVGPDPAAEGAEAVQGTLVGFRVDDGKLDPVGTDIGLNGCYRGARGIVSH